MAELLSSTYMLPQVPNDPDGGDGSPLLLCLFAQRNGRRDLSQFMLQHAISMLTSASKNRGGLLALDPTGCAHSLIANLFRALTGRLPSACLVVTVRYMEQGTAGKSTGDKSLGRQRRLLCAECNTT
jgi:hypothetical protein